MPFGIPRPRRGGTAGAMRRLPARLLLCLLALLPALAPGQAADRYAGEVVVADERPAARAEGLREILRQVVLRLAGRREVLQHPALETLLAQAPDLVQQFRYRQAPSGEGRLLWARFDPDALNRRLAAEGIPVWHGPRPRVLVWLGEERGVQRVLLNPSEDPDLRRALEDAARARGMPLQLPLMDLEDQAALAPADLWADYAAAIQRASARYPHDLVLTGRLRPFADGRWAADWTLWEGERAEPFQVQGDSREAVVAAGIERAQDLLAARRQPALAAGGEEVRVRIEGVSDLAAYGRLMQALRGEGSLRELRLRAADGHDLVLAVTAAARDALLQALDRSLLLRPLPAGEAGEGGLAAIPVEGAYLFTGGGG